MLSVGFRYSMRDLIGGITNYCVEAKVCIK